MIYSRLFYILEKKAVTADCVILLQYPRFISLYEKRYVQ